MVPDVRILSWRSGGWCTATKPGQALNYNLFSPTGSRLHSDCYNRRKLNAPSPMAITLKTAAELDQMRVACRLAAEVLDYIAPFVLSLIHI